MQLLKPVVKSLGWKVASTVTGVDCRVIGFYEGGRKKLGRLQLCAKHLAAYRTTQHRLAQKRLNALRSAARRVARQAKKVSRA